MAANHVLNVGSATTVGVSVGFVGVIGLVIILIIIVSCYMLAMYLNITMLLLVTIHGQYFSYNYYCDLILETD